MPRSIIESSLPKLPLYFAKKRNICKLLHISLRKHRSIAEDKFSVPEIYTPNTFIHVIWISLKKIYRDFFLCFLCCFITLLKLSFWSKSRADEKSWPEAYFRFKHNIESRKRLDKQTILIRIWSVIILKENYRPLGHCERGEQSDAFISHSVARNEK